MVIAELLVKLNTNDYVDGIVIHILGKYAPTVSRCMQQALKVVEYWCRIVNLGVHLERTVLVSFTKRMNLDDIKFITFGTQLHQ